ncbi:MAG TPA: hypothetical protein VHO23_02800 [Candidatus Paceibacterota bacterium]|nr:hypothetical protein [Candidatus Paceibacterota bacterium]
MKSNHLSIRAISGVVSLGVAFSAWGLAAPVAKAETLENLEAQLATLQEKLAALKQAETEESTSALPVYVAGAHNDYALFRSSIEVESLKRTTYISVDPYEAFTYEIRDGHGRKVTKSTGVSLAIDSTAKRSGDYFVIRKGDTANLSLTVKFDPLPIDEGDDFRLRLLTLEYANKPIPAEKAWKLLPVHKYQTDRAFIED